MLALGAGRWWRERLAGEGGRGGTCWKSPSPGGSRQVHGLFLKIHFLSQARSEETRLRGHRVLEKSFLTVTANLPAALCLHLLGLTVCVGLNYWNLQESLIEYLF